MTVDMFSRIYSLRGVIRLLADEPMNQEHSTICWGKFHMKNNGRSNPLPRLNNITRHFKLCYSNQQYK